MRRTHTPHSNPGVARPGEGPLMARLGPAGLCGTFNGDTTDDFTTSAGIAEGTAALFVDSWRAENCPTALEREVDPCAMSHLNSECLQGVCGLGQGVGGSQVGQGCRATSRDRGTGRPRGQ